MLLGTWLLPYLLLNSIMLSGPGPVLGQATFKIGASADDASRHNFGVKVNIVTHVYNTTPNTLQYFWVGEDLSNGAFIQFGYSLEPGVNCLRGAIVGGSFSCQQNSETIPASDARWQWQYWPDSSKSDFYFAMGPAESAGYNSTPQEYEILPSTTGTWHFLLNGKIASETDFPVSPSEGPALIVAEGSTTNESYTLGPVAYSGLSYFDGHRWTTAASLIAVSACGTSVACAANQYGASSTGPDAMIAGSGEPRSPDGTILWTSGEEILVVDVHPGLQFFVTTPLGVQAFDGEATVTVPRGMFAYVSLPNTVTSSAGILGWLGGQDHFNGWKGAVNSSNVTVQILMNSNKTVAAFWSTDRTLPTAITVLTLGIVFAFTVSALYKRGRKPPE